MTTTAQPKANTRPRPPQDFRKKAETDKILDQTVEIAIDGAVYKLTPADLTGLQEMRIRRETGMSVIEIIQGLQEHPGIDYLGMFMWACRLSAGEEDATLEASLKGISYGSEVVIKEDAVPDSPEA